MGSLFPFGFLKKLSGTDLSREIPVWPAPVEYRRFAGAAARRPRGGELRQARAGNEGEMIALRQYEHGDSHRLIHWKASARTGRLLIRQFSSQNSDACSLWLRTDAAVWTRPEQFELLLSFAATLAQDLFRAGRLQSAAIDGGPPGRRRSVSRTSRASSTGSPRRSPLPAPPARAAAGPRRGRARFNLMTFEPDGARGVAAFINGTKTAAT